MLLLKRTHTCGELRAEHVGKIVCLNGWVENRRDHGGVLFIDLKDRYGLTQVVFHPERDKELHEKASSLRPQFVVGIRGDVLQRPAGTVNRNLPTGEIEVTAQALEIYNESVVPPFELSDDQEISEELRLKYRYLDLRRKRMLEGISGRDRILRAIRSCLSELHFVEVETPLLTRYTPGGARNFLVPSRMQPGAFYALAESPQLYKQLLMVAGLDRYFQIVRCFRDEAFRADRQAEFTQLDLEMSFVSEDDVLGVVEKVIARVFQEGLGMELKTPLLRMPYEEAMNRYGTDKPDLRFEMPLAEATDLFGASPFRVVQDVVARGGSVFAFVARGAAAWSRKELDQMESFVRGQGGKGLLWFRKESEGLSGPTAKHFSPEEIRALERRLSPQAGDAVFLIADAPREAALGALGALRVHVAGKLGLIRSGDWRAVWIVDFPLFEWSAEEKRLVARHHPFTSPWTEDLPLLEENPAKVRARAYDLVLNGIELGGGSIRIHRTDVQQRVFRVLGMSDSEADEKFRFLLEALRFGAPPHGGIALGMDRFVMLLLGRSSIREVIAFPKTQRAACLLTGAPAGVSPDQLRELHLRVVPEDAPQNRPQP